MVAEKLLTRAKNAMNAGSLVNQVHARRQIARAIKDRAVVKELFSDIAAKIATRPGGYTRIIKLGQRLGDGSEVAVLELVDYNTGEAPDKKAKARKDKKEAKKKKASEAARGKEAKSV